MTNKYIEEDLSGEDFLFCSSFTLLIYSSLFYFGMTGFVIGFCFFLVINALMKRNELKKLKN